MILARKNIIITGVSRGFGLHIAQAMWNNKASLFLVARSAQSLEALQKEFAKSAHPGQQVHTVVVDLKLPEATDMIINQSKRVWKKLDGLVNNAGIPGPIGRVWENDWNEWQETIQVNLLAPIALCRACVPWMEAGGGGKIINVSGGGAAGPRPNFSAYGTSKAALVRFSEILAHELRDQNIQVNCIAPGSMKTKMIEAVKEAGPEKAGSREYAAALNSLEGEESVPQRAVELCCFLASPASDFITGRLISAVWDPWEKLSLYQDELRESDIYTLRRIVPRDRGQDWG
jgi:3-oxoacyl-[acyl-carrier protein] reductase